MTTAAGIAAAGGDALALIRLMREAVAASAPREALLLRLGALAPRLRQPHRRRLVEDALDLLRGGSRIRLFTLPNADLVAVAPVGTEWLRDAESALRTLLAAEGPDAPPVARLRLPEGAATLFAALESALAPEAAAPPSRAPAGDDVRDAAGFAIEHLAAMERGLVLRFRIGDQNRSPLEWLTAA
jgi:hypothetical protein